LKELDAGEGEEVVRGDATDLDVMLRAMAGCDACIHLAAIPVEAPFADILHSNLLGCWTAFEAARRTGCGRIVFASSNHATGFYRTDERIGPGDPIKPDTYYGVSKAFGEALGRMYHEKFGLAVACLRIGSARERPEDTRQLSTWLSPGDLARLVKACLTAPDLGFAIVYGVSNNRRGWWDLEPGRRLGYEPEDDAEIFAGEVPPAKPSAFQGGAEFTDPGTTP
jgi:uronate dehydrogenase